MLREGVLENREWKGYMNHERGGLMLGWEAGKTHCNTNICQSLICSVLYSWKERYESKVCERWEGWEERVSPSFPHSPPSILKKKTNLPVPPKNKLPYSNGTPRLLLLIKPKLIMVQQL